MAKKQGKKKVRVVTKLGVPVFKYTSVCHEAPATKSPLLMPSGNRIGMYAGAAPDATEGSLGKFRCTQCGKPCKVSRQKNVQETTKAEVLEVANAVQ